ncbi:unnamed protein product [Caenorhabditis bovis]|uniref:ShKT domain-containing protein n=1 Tax=Caenorhabditis bovis TaxID=2654633 RepID=A0A8S1EWY5_9PELO|nr:unnamed protein product [Caenorhabditis bovis]
MLSIFLVIFLQFATIYGQYGMFGGYGMNYGINPYMGGIYGTTNLVADDEPPKNKRDCRGLPSMRARSICRYGNPMGGTFGCTDMSPQCALWASTGQCATNPLTMRSMCAMSCGLCLGTGLGAIGTGLGAAYPFVGRSIYETGIFRSPDADLKPIVARFL